MLEDIFTHWDRPVDILATIDYLTVRVLSGDNPCAFDLESDTADDLRWVWRLLDGSWEGGWRFIAADSFAEQIRAVREDWWAKRILRAAAYDPMPSGVAASCAPGLNLL